MKKICGAKHGGHMCKLKPKHKGKHKCGRLIVTIPISRCAFTWAGEGGK